MKQINRRIKEKRLENDLTLLEIANRLGVKEATVQRYESGSIKNIKHKTICDLAEILHTTPAYLMGWEEAEESPIPGLSTLPQLVKVPRLGVIACGQPILAEQDIEEYDTVPDYVKCDFTLLCSGDSMINARIYDGDIVCIKKQETVESGQIAAVLIDDADTAEATLKRVKFIKDGVALLPENPAYEPLVFIGDEAQKVRIIGIATHFISVIK